MTLVRNALAAFAMATGGTAFATEVTMRYECTLADGTVTLVAQDLQAGFGGSTARCMAIETEPAEPQPVPAPPVVRHVTGAALALAASPHAALIRETASRNNLDPRLLAAVIQVESRHRSDARSRKGAVGLMQLMPATGARYGVYDWHNLFDPALNLDVGTRYLSDLIDTFGSIELALAAYNAGENAVLRYGRRVPPFPETRSYVRSVLALLRAGP